MKKFFVALVLCLITIFYGTEAFSLDGMNIGEQLHDISKDVMKNQGYSDDAIEFIMDKESWKKYGISKDDSKKSLEDLWDEGKIPSKIKDEVRKYLAGKYAPGPSLWGALKHAYVQSIIIPHKDFYLYWTGDPDFKYIDDEAREIATWNEYIYDSSNSRLKDEGYVRIPKDELLAIIDEEDLAFIQSQNEKLYTIDTGKATEGDAAKFTGGTTGFYTSSMKDITLPEEFYKGTNVTNEDKKTTFHHETQHAKDFAAMKRVGYTGVFMNDVITTKDMTDDKSKRIDKISALLWQAIIEARAYSEEAVYAYAKMKTAKYQGKKEEEERWKKVYESKDNPARTAYKKAIEEDHKTVEEARHVAAVALLNSCHFIGGYTSERAKFDYPGTYHLAPEKIIGILNKDDGGKSKLTMDDLYSAPAFWTRLCSYDDLKDTSECKKAKKKIKNLEEDIKYSKSTEARKSFQDKNCTIKEGFCDEFKDWVAKYINVPGPDDENFDADEVFRKIDKIFATDKTCASKTCKDKERILTTKEDEKYYNKNKDAYRICCSLDFDMDSACSACGSCKTDVFLKPSE